jgi:CO dehydrogenase nickel-insertion accessory protein CooC1
MDGAAMSGLRIGIFGKGGAGKSTVTVFLARALRERGYPVLVLDADSTNHGLATALGADREPAPLLDHFGGMVFSGGLVTCPVDDPTRLQGADVRLEDLPDRYVARNAGGIHVLVAGKLGGLGPGAGCDGPVAKIARDLRVTVQGDLPVTVIDYKAGFEDAARGAVTALDWAVVVLDPTVAAIRMAWHLAAMVTEMERGVPPSTLHLGSRELVEIAVRFFREARVRGVLGVLNRVPTLPAETHMRNELRGSGARVASVFVEEPAIARQWLHGLPLDTEHAAEAGRLLARELETMMRGAPALARA